MASATGLTRPAKPPLHRKYSKAKALEQIRDRYRGMKGKFDAQVRALQADEAFLDRCAVLYEQGYKDWHILSAVMNLMMMVEGERRGYDLRTRVGLESYQKLPDLLETVVIPPSRFDGLSWEMAFKMHAATCLRTYGFESRAQAIAMDGVLRFLRERMLHFEHDLPHPPMFGRPPAKWPKL